MILLKIMGYLLRQLIEVMFGSNKDIGFDVKHHESPRAKPSIEKDPKLDLKALAPYLRNIFIGKGDILPVIIASDLNMQQVECLVKVLKRFKSYWVDY